MEHNYNPLVSIIIPVYNGEKFLKEAIDSALAQTYKKVEILVINDGSIDKTEEIAKSYGNKIRYFKKENGGVASALNLGIKNMNGQYFSWLSCDDIYYPQKIEKQVNYIKRIKKKNIILFSNYDLINELGEKISPAVKFNAKTIKKKPEYIFLRGFLNGITLLIPRSAFKKIGLFDEKLKCTQDYDMWIRMQKNYHFILINKVLCQTRLHSLQDSKISPAAIIEGDKIWQKMIDSFSDMKIYHLEKNLFYYYYKMYLFLEYTPYKETQRYCFEKCIKLDKNRITKIIKYNKNVLIQKKRYVDYLIETQGFNNMLKNIIFSCIKRRKNGH